MNDKLCVYCGIETDELAANPFVWPVCFPDIEGDINKHHCMSCVINRCKRYEHMNEFIKAQELRHKSALSLIETQREVIRVGMEIVNKSVEQTNSVIEERDRYLKMLKLVHAYYREPTSVFDTIAKEMCIIINDDYNIIWELVEQMMAGTN